MTGYYGVKLPVTFLMFFFFWPSAINILSSCCSSSWTSKVAISNLPPALTNSDQCVCQGTSKGRVHPTNVTWCQWSISASVNAVWSRNPLVSHVQGQHPLKCGVVAGEHGYILHQSGRKRKAGGPGGGAGSLKSTQGTPPPVKEHCLLSICLLARQ